MCIYFSEHDKKYWRFQYEIDIDYEKGYCSCDIKYQTRDNHIKEYGMKKEVCDYYRFIPRNLYEFEEMTDKEKAEALYFHIKDIEWCYELTHGNYDYIIDMDPIFERYIAYDALPTIRILKKGKNHFKNDTKIDYVGINNLYN